MKSSLSERLTSWSEEFDRIFNHILGYVIAFTSLVAFADVLGNGQVIGSLPALYWVWVIAQGMTVEFQVFVLIKRMPGYWQDNRKMFCLYTGFIACLGLMSVFIGSVFVEHDTGHTTIEVAMATLGIPHIGFIYMRSALAILLVALIAIDRAIEQHRHTQGEEEQRVQVEQEEMQRALVLLKEREQEITILLSQVSSTLSEMRTGTTWVSEEVRMVRQVVDEVRTTVPSLIEHTLVSRIEEVQQEFQASLQRNLFPSPQVPPRNRLELVRGTTTSKSDTLPDVEQFLETERERGHVPTLSEIMQATGCSKTTASRHRKRMDHHDAVVHASR